MRISFEFLKRKIERGFITGVHPEYKFVWNNNRYCINADLDKFYIHYIKPTSDKVDAEEMVEDFYPVWKRMIEDDPYTLCEYNQIGEFSSFDELYLNGYIENSRSLKDIWDDLEFILLDEDFVYYFQMGDSVFIKDMGIYGVVKNIKNINGIIHFFISTEGSNWEERVNERKWISCRVEQLEYDERPETIKSIKDSYAAYLYRISH